jgi:sarcosine oxidase subunit beta
MFDTMVISFQIGIYIQQVPHGSFVSGIGEKEPPNHNIKSTWQWLEFYTGEMLKILPILKDVRVVRHWAGSYERTPDAAPILGEYPGTKGYFLATGFSGHGFMIAPMTAVCTAQLITGEKTSVDISALSIERFKTGKYIVEPSVVG